MLTMMSDRNSISNDFERAEELIGYKFQDRELLERALTHSSYANERSGKGIKDNERLEFLGDAVLGFVISDMVFRDSAEDEGGLTRIKSHLVSGRTIRKVTEPYRLGRFLRLGKGEELDGGRTKRSLLVNAFEAVVAAIFLDGGLGAARDFISRTYSPIMQGFDRDQLLREDYKSYLQELFQAKELRPPEYVVIGEKGPEHAKRFTVEIRLGKRKLIRGEGRSKKSAEQTAAQALLKRIDNEQIDLAELARKGSRVDPA